jgi:hypothetical protein
MQPTNPKSSDWYDVYEKDKLIISMQDKASADRKAFAENSSFRNKEDKIWNVKKRTSKIIIDATS